MESLEEACVVAFEKLAVLGSVSVPKLVAGEKIAAVGFAKPAEGHYLPAATLCATVVVAAPAVAWTAAFAATI